MSTGRIHKHSPPKSAGQPEASTSGTSSSSRQPPMQVVIDDDEEDDDDHLQRDDTPRKDKHQQHHKQQHQQQHDKQKQKDKQQHQQQKKKRPYDVYASASESAKNGPGGGASKGAVSKSGNSTTVISIDDEDDEAEADADGSAGKPNKSSTTSHPHSLKKQKVSSASSKPAASASASAPASGGGASRLILRLPNSRSSSTAPASKPTTSPNKLKKSKKDAIAAATTGSTKLKGKKQGTKKSALPTGARHSPYTHQPPTVHSSPLSSVDSDTARRALADSGLPTPDAGNVSDLDLPRAPLTEFTYTPFIQAESSDSSDGAGYSDLDDVDLDDTSDADDGDDDDESDEMRLERREEKFLIKDRMRKLQQRSQRGSRNTSRSPRQLSFDNDHEPLAPLDVQQGTTADLDIFQTAAPGVPQSALNVGVGGQEQLLFEIARVPKKEKNSSGAHRHRRRNRSAGSSAGDGPVTWSGAEDSGLDDLDELLGLTANDSAVLFSDEDEDEEGRTIRFEDFLNQDDGDSEYSSDDEDEDEEGGDSGDETEEQDQDKERESVVDLTTDVDDEHISTTKAVVQNGGFIFFKSGVDDSSDDDASSDDMLNGAMDEEEAEDDGGDTTDTLDDSDHLGLIRFGIEAVDEDDEDAEEMLSAAIRERYLSDARNMGLSISINALAEQPEAVILKTAKTLGVTKETAAKILTSVGMSILMNGANASAANAAWDREVEEARAAARRQIQQQQQAQQEQNRKGKGKQVHNPAEIPALAAEPETNMSASLLSDPRFATDANADAQPSAPAPTVESQASTQAVPSAPSPAQSTTNPTGPVMGDFAPSGGADLCVVVSNDVPAPSPFSARKRQRRRARRMTDGSPSQWRGQSVSSISNQSIASAPPYHSNSHSSEEPSYNIILDIDDLVDVNMLPGMSELSEEGTDVDEDTASVSTALTGTNSFTNVGGVGDVSRWNRVPIGAFRSQNPESGAYTSLASAIFSGTRDPNIAHHLSLHGGMSISTAPTSKRHGKKIRKHHIPVSPVLFPVMGQSLKAISSVKSRKDRRKDRKVDKRVKKEGTPNAVSHPTTGARAAFKSNLSSASTIVTEMSQTHKDSIQSIPSINLSSPTHLGLSLNSSLPSDGFYVSPLFKGVASSFSIPPLSLGDHH